MESAAEEPASARHLKPARSRGRTALIVLIAAPLVLALLVVIGWTIDSASAGGKVHRNVSIGGRDVSRLSEEELPGVVAQVAETYASTPIRIVTPDATYTTTAGDAGLAVAKDATVTQVLQVGRTGAFPVRPFSWLKSFLTPRHAEMRFTVTEATLRATLIKLEGRHRTAPIEPTIKATKDGFVALAGKPGRGLDPFAVSRLLPMAASGGASPVIVSVQLVALASRFNDDDAKAIATEATRLTQKPLEIDLVGGKATVPPAKLRSWLVAAPGTDGLALAMSPDAPAELRTLIPDLEGRPVDARFEVVGGQVQLIAGKDGAVCCTAEAPATILDAIKAGKSTVELQTMIDAPTFTTEKAQALGIKEEIGQPDAFGPTTHHKGGEPRVTNIHRIADIVRGHVILPGEKFSLNTFVGPRTQQKGFVEAGVIYMGTFQHDIGGGVSQFATTTFNAALYAGLDFGEYQSHSIFIDRYPKGHEATVSYPHPDLELINNTHYGVLIWPEYTGTSLTVRLFSTKTVTVALSPPTSSAQGSCTRWTTRRTRTYLDGTTKTDSVSATYRPAEGVNC